MATIVTIYFITHPMNQQDNVTYLRVHFFHAVLRYVLTAFIISCSDRS